MHHFHLVVWAGDKRHLFFVFFKVGKIPLYLAKKIENQYKTQRWFKQTKNN